MRISTWLPSSSCVEVFPIKLCFFKWFCSAFIAIVYRWRLCIYCKIIYLLATIAANRSLNNLFSKCNIQICVYCTDMCFVYTIFVSRTVFVSQIGVIFADAPRDLQRLADRVLPKFGKLLEPRSPSVQLTSSSSAKTSGNSGNKSRAVQRQQPTAAAPAAASEEDTLWPGEGQQGTMVLKMVMLLVFVLERLAVRTGEQPASAAGSGAPPTAATGGDASSSTASAAGGDPTADSASLLEEDPAPRPIQLLVTDPSKASYFEVALRYLCMHEHDVLRVRVPYGRAYIVRTML